jgi:hypothetical protein
MQTNFISTQQLLDELETQQVLNNEQVSRIQDYILNIYKPPISSYIKSLMNIGAFLSAFFLMLFVFSILGIYHLIGEHALNLLILGTIFIGGALFVPFYNRNVEDSFAYLFNRQLSLIFMVTGKSLFCFGVISLFNHSHRFVFLDVGWILSFTILLLTLLTYSFYSVFIERFLSVFALLYVMTFSFYHENPLFVSLFFGFQLFAFIFLLIKRNISSLMIPIIYALAGSLSGIMLSIAGNPLTPVLRDLITHISYIPLINISLSLGLIASIIHLGSVQKRVELEPLIIASVGAIALGFLSATGILLALILLVLGRAKFDKLLYLMGGIFLGVFLFFYYYNLSFTLMYKSSILVGSGVLLLAGSWYIKSHYIQEVKEL